jgi:hypothetical protein
MRSATVVAAGARYVLTERAAQIAQPGAKQRLTPLPIMHGNAC